MLKFAGDAERNGEIGGPDHDGVDPGHREQLLAGIHGALGFDLEHYHRVRVDVLDHLVVAELYKLHSQNQGFRMFRRSPLMENKWRAARYGINGKLIDFGKQTEVPERELIEEYLAFVDDVLDELELPAGSRVHPPIMKMGTGADRQLQVYRDTGDMKAVMDYIIEETEVGVDEVEVAHRTRRLIRGMNTAEQSNRQLNQLAFDPELTPGARNAVRWPAGAAFGEGYRHHR